MLKGFHAQLTIDPTAQPRFLKTRLVPIFSLFKEKIEKDLEWLKTLCIITPVSFSDWAVPIVSVLKNDTNIRICSDYKSGGTISQMLI